MTTYEGQLTATDLKIGIVVSRFNDLITERLLSGALDALRRHGGDEKLIEIAHVPGAFEMPLAANRRLSSSDTAIQMGAGFFLSTSV